jgi:hypothetical protein
MRLSVDIVVQCFLEQKTSSGVNEKYTDYSQVPWFRKNWFAILCFFIFTPALFLVLVTGDVYYKKKGQLTTYGKVAKNFSLVWCVFTFIYLAVAAFQNKSDPSQVSSNLPQGTSNPSQVPFSSESESAMGYAPRVGNLSLQHQQGTYFSWVSPPGWRVADENKNGIDMTSPDGIYSAGYGWSTYNIAMGGIMTPQNWLQWNFQQAESRGILQIVRILSVQNLPNQGNFQRIEAMVSYTKNNVPWTSKVTVGVSDVNGTMQACYMKSYGAANDKFQDAQSFLPQIANSITLTNPQGGSIAQNNQQSWADVVVNQSRKNARILDPGKRRYENTIRGTIDLVGPDGQTTHTWSQNKNYYWKERGTDRVVGTDTYQSPGPGYEPQRPY